MVGKPMGNRRWVGRARRTWGVLVLFASSAGVAVAQAEGQAADEHVPILQWMLVAVGAFALIELLGWRQASRNEKVCAKVKAKKGEAAAAEKLANRRSYQARVVVAGFLSAFLIVVFGGINTFKGQTILARVVSFAGGALIILLSVKVWKRSRRPV